MFTLLHIRVGLIIRLGNGKCFNIKHACNINFFCDKNAQKKWEEKKPKKSLENNGSMIYVLKKEKKVT